MGSAGIGKLFYVRQPANHLKVQMEKLEICNAPRRIYFTSEMSYTFFLHPLNNNSPSEIRPQLHECEEIHFEQIDDSWNEARAKEDNRASKQRLM